MGSKVTNLKILDCQRGTNAKKPMCDDISKDVSDIDLIVVISEVNMVGSNPRNGGLKLVLLVLCARTRRCSPPLNQLRLGKICTWETLPPLKSKAKERWS